MRLSITTNVSRSLYANDQSPHVTSAFFVGRDLADNDTSKFEVEYSDTKCITVNQNNYSTLSVNVFDLVNVNQADTRFIQIFYTAKPDQPEPIPLRFQLTLGSALIGNVSQFTLVNLQGFTQAILIDGLVDPGEDLAYLTIIVGGLAS